MSALDRMTEQVMNLTDSISRITDNWIPNEVYVPEILTKSASFFSKTIPTSLQDVPYVDLTDVVFWQTVIIILIHPVIWNILGRFEYYTRAISRIFVKPTIGVYMLALWIFVAGLYRDALFVIAMDRQVKIDQMDTLFFKLAGTISVLVGGLLVLTSFYQLGMCGTYLGDYFGILMDKRVTAFPFNVVDDPMYDGSTLAFLGKAVL